MKHVLKLAACVALVSMSQTTWAQAESDLRLIEVSGTAERYVTPDEIYVSIILVDQTRGRDRISAHELESHLLDSLTVLGIDHQNLSLNQTDGTSIRIRRKRQTVISKKLTLKLTTAQQVQDVFNMLDNMQIELADIERTSHSEMDQIRKEVRQNAMRAGKAKAAYMLDAVGNDLGALHSVNESSHVYGRVKGLANMVYDEVAIRSMDSVTSHPAIELQKIQVTVTVNLAFEIEGE